MFRYIVHIQFGVFQSQFLGGQFLSLFFQHQKVCIIFLRYISYHLYYIHLILDQNDLIFFWIQ